MHFDNKYLNSIPSQHKIRPKFMAWLSSLLSVLEDSATLLRSMDAAFDLNTATGQQLDIIGNVVGISRLLDFEPRYAPPLLPDEFYRKVLKAKISLNQWDGTIEGIRSLWAGAFDGYRLDVVDHQDMSMTLRVYGVESMFESEFISHGYLAPKPESVRVNYEFTLTRTVDTILFVGGKVEYVMSKWMLNSLSATNISDVTSCLHAGGKLAVYSRFYLNDILERG